MHDFEIAICIRIFHLRNRFDGVSSPWLVYCSRCLLLHTFSFLLATLFFVVGVFENLIKTFICFSATRFLAMIENSSSLAIDLILWLENPLDWHFFNYHSNKQCICRFDQQQERVARVMEIQYLRCLLFEEHIKFADAIKHSPWVVLVTDCLAGVEMSTFLLSSSRLSNYPFVKYILKVSLPDSFSCLGFDDTHQHIMDLHTQTMCFC